MPDLLTAHDIDVRRARRWFERSTFWPDQIPPVPTRRATVSVVIPTRNEARTIGAICSVVRKRLLGTLVDELIVVDCESTDRTAEIAEVSGARVERVSGILPDTPWVLGKGEALWRALAVVDTDVVCFVDGDIANFEQRFVERLVAPLLADAELGFSKGFYRRPLRLDSVMVPGAGGRVTELTARPLLNLLYPELAGFLQPLAGEYAARVRALREIPFFTGYGVDVGLLIDLVNTIGLEAMAQVDLDERVHRNRPLRDLRMMAAAVSSAILSRGVRDGRVAFHGSLEHATLLPGIDGSLETAHTEQLERPPMAEFLHASRP